MRIEKAVQLELHPNVQQGVQRSDDVPTEMDVLPKLTVDQLEEVLEERTLADRRKVDIGYAFGSDRRTFKRRRSD